MTDTPEVAKWKADVAKMPKQQEFTDDKDVVVQTVEVMDYKGDGNFSVVTKTNSNGLKPIIVKNAEVQPDTTLQRPE